MLKDHHFVKKYKTFFRIFRKLLMSKSKDKWMSFMSHRLCRSLKGMVLFGQERTHVKTFFNFSYNSNAEITDVQKCLLSMISHSMVRANLIKSEQLVDKYYHSINVDIYLRGTESASFEIPLSEQNLISKNTSKC